LGPRRGEAGIGCPEFSRAAPAIVVERRAARLADEAIPTAGPSALTVRRVGSEIGKIEMVHIVAVPFFPSAQMAGVLLEQSRRAYTGGYSTGSQSPAEPVGFNQRTDHETLAASMIVNRRSQTSLADPRL